MGCSQKVIDAVRDITPQTISQYPNYDTTYQNLSEFYNLPKSSILLTNGLDEAIKLIFECLMGSNSNYLIPIPTFSMYKIFGEYTSSKCIEIEYLQDLSFPINQILSLNPDSIDLIVLVNPNNPTGTSLKAKDIESILKNFHKSIVVVDEAYIEFGGNSSISLISDFENLIVLRTFSKAFGMAGLRCGVILTRNRKMKLLRKVIPPFSVNSIAIKGVEIAIKDKEFLMKYLDVITENRLNLTAFLEKQGFHVLNSMGNFILCNFGIQNDYINRTLRKSNILIKNLTENSLLRNCSRITIGSLDDINLLISCLTEILSRPVVLFDIDGVLIDVSNSYRKAILQTVNTFSPVHVKLGRVDELKSKPGYNNDWDVVDKILKENQIQVSKKRIVNEFQRIYLGDYKSSGLILNERWIFPVALLSEIRNKYRLGIVTGRPKKEAELVLRQNKMKQIFDVVITMNDCPPNKLKPNPYGIQKAMSTLKVNSGWYLGDSPDDIIAALNAGLIPIGISVCDPLKSANLKEYGAQLVILDYEDLEAYF